MSLDGFRLFLAPNCSNKEPLDASGAAPSVINGNICNKHVLHIRFKNILYIIFDTLNIFSYFVLLRA